MVLMPLVLAGVGEGKIGATADECAKIYGSECETAPNGSKKVFKKGGVVTICYFMNGVCAAVSYELAKPSKVLHPPIGKDTRFTAEQEAMLLNLNGGGSIWKQESKQSFADPRDGVYRTEGGKLQALVNFVAVNVETLEYFNARKAQEVMTEVDKVIAGFGSEANPQPKPVVAALPPTEDEQKQAEMNQRLEDMQKRMDESNKRIKDSFQKASEAIEQLPK